MKYKTYGPRHEISNNVVSATSKVSDQPAHTRSLIRAFACRLNVPSMNVKLLTEHHFGVSTQALILSLFLNSFNKFNKT